MKSFLFITCLLISVSLYSSQVENCEKTLSVYDEIEDTQKELNLNFILSDIGSDEGILTIENPKGSGGAGKRRPIFATEKSYLGYHGFLKNIRSPVT